jgi:hypothetical protein
MHHHHDEEENCTHHAVHDEADFSTYLSQEA